MSGLAFAVIFALVTPIFSTNCGRAIVKPDLNGIVGGRDAIPYSWPWQAAIFQYGLISGWHQTCGGTLIANQWILTAAHCLYDQPSPTKYQVKLGVHNKVNNMENGLEIVSSVSEIFPHPEYDRGTMSNDVALIKLSVPIFYNDHVSPICLPRPNVPLPAAGTQSVITGWGLMATNGSYSAMLKQATISLISQDECKLDYPTRFREMVMFCAGTPFGEKDSCDGDSGGPLVYYEKDSQRWTQLGVTSWGGSECGKTGQPGAYAKISTFTEWIEKFTKVEYPK